MHPTTKIRALASATTAAAVALAIPAGSAGQPALPQQDATEPRPVVAEKRTVPRELLVRFQAGVTTAARATVRRQHGAERESRLPVPGLELVTVAAGTNIRETAAALERDARIAYAEPNFVYRLSGIPNDPLFPRLWGLHDAADVDIDAPEAWDVTTGSRDVVVAVVDSGVAYAHPDLAPNTWTNQGETGSGKETNHVDDDGNGLVDDVRGWDWVQGDNEPLDFNGHGTHVAGTIGGRGNDAVGIAGVNWNVRVMPLRVANAAGALATDDVVRAFAYAAAKGAKVVNASFGGPSPSQAISDVIAASSSTLFVVAAGNGGVDGIGDDNGSSPTYPCSYPAANIVCVAASNRSGALASFSNFASASVDLAAPGTAILSAAPAYDGLFSDGFETDIAGRWVAGRSAASIAWARTAETRASGTWSLSDSPGGPYANNTNTWIATAMPLSLASRTGCVVDYALELSTETNGDGLLVEASSDGVGWTMVAGWTGSSGGSFFPLTDDLSAFDGQSSAWIRFRLVSDGTTTADGAHVDDVAVRCLAPTFGPTDYLEFDGTSMATPHVAGVAALVWAYRPAVSVANVKDVLLRGVDPAASLAGKTVAGGRLNASRSLALIAAVTSDRTPPTNPTVTSRTHSVGTWSRVGTVEVTFTGASDAESGVDGFSYEWSASPTTIPDTTKDAEETATGTRSASLLDGSWYFHLRTRDNAGNWSDAAHFGPFQVDATAPSPPTIGGRAFASPFTLDASFPVEWTGGDSAAGVGSYDIRYRKTGYNEYSGTEAVWQERATTTTGIFRGVPGSTYCFAATARDRAGNLSEQGGERCTAVPVNNTALKRSGRWAMRRASGSYLGTFSEARRRGSRLSLTGVQAKRLALVATRCPRCGTVRVSWDRGVSRKVRLAAPSVRRRQLIALVAFESVRTVSVRIAVTSSGRAVKIEGLAVSRS